MVDGRSLLLMDFGHNLIDNGIIFPMILMIVLFLEISFTKRYAFRLTRYEPKCLGRSIIANCRSYSVAEP